MDNQLTEKIKALLRMAEHPNSNEHEASLALQKAQKLLLENNLTRADVLTDNTSSTPVGIGKIDGTETTGYNWKCHLLAVLAHNSLCQVIRSPSLNQWHLFGTYDNVKGVIEMYHWITPELERMGMLAWSKYKDDGTGHENARSWKLGYFLGAITTINERLAESFNTFATETGKAIVPYNTQLVKEAVHRVYPRLSTSHISSRSYDGRNAGRLDGRNITLRPNRKLSGVMMLQ